MSDEREESNDVIWAKANERNVPIFRPSLAPRERFLLSAARFAAIWFKNRTAGNALNSRDGDLLAARYLAEALEGYSDIPDPSKRPEVKP